MKQETALKQTVQLAFPMAMARSLNMFIGFYCVFLLARLGHDVLAASSFISSLQGLFFVSASSLLTAVSVCIGYAYGANKPLEIGSIFQQGLLLAWIITIPCMIIFYNIGPILTFFGQKPHIVAIDATFFHYFLFYMPLSLTFFTFQQLFISVHHQKAVLWIMTLSSILLAFFAYSLVNGKFGLPRLGIIGLPVSYLINGVFTCSSAIIYCLSIKSFREYKLFDWRFKENFHYLKRIFSVGWPIALNGMGDLLSYFFIAIMIGWISETAMMAQQISLQYALLILVPTLAIAQASGILISQAYGAKNPAQFKAYHRSALGLAIGLNLIALFVFYVFAKHLINLFIDAYNPVNTSLVVLATILLFIRQLRQVFDAITNVYTGSLRGFFDTRYPMYLGLTVRLLALQPIAYFIGFKLHAGVVGLVSTGVAMNALSALILWRRWKKQLIKKVLEIQTQEEKVA